MPDHQKVVGSSRQKKWETHQKVSAIKRTQPILPKFCNLNNVLGFPPLQLRHKGLANVQRWKSNL